MKKIAEFIPHLCIAMMLSMIVFVVLDGFNPLMRWLNSDVSKIFIVLSSLVGLITAVMLIVRQRRRRVKRKDPATERPEA